MLVLDSGNALFRGKGMTDATSMARATFILDTMNALGTQAMAVGARDLVGGRDALKKQASKLNMKLLSANLVDDDRRPIFEPSTVVTVGGVRVGVIGVTAGTEHGAEPPVPVAIAEAKKLRPHVDVVVVLAAVPYNDALQISNQAGDAIDFILQSHESRGPGIAQKGPGNYVMPSGERGRQVGRLALNVGPKGPFVDLTELDRAKQTIKILDQQIAETHKRMDAAKDPAGKKALEATLDSFTQRKNDLEKELAQAPSASARTFSLDFPTLGADVKDDPKLQAQVAKYDPGH